MSNLNNFNTCPRCGTPNPLVSKFCFQCGSQLKSPDTPIVCNKCNTINSGRASYCKTCGNKLVGGSITKPCPRCNTSVDANASICNKCGFMFASVGMVKPTDPSVKAGLIAKSEKKAKAVSKASPKARFSGVITTLLALAWLYFMLMPSFMALPMWQSFPFMVVDGVATSGFSLIVLLIKNISTIFTTFSPFDYIVLAVFAIMLIFAVVELIVGIVKIVKGNLAVKPKTFVLILAIIVGLLVAFITIVQFSSQINIGFLQGIFNWFTSMNVSSFGTVIMSYPFYTAPAYLGIVWLLSLCFRMSKKELEVKLIER
ncbi:MAG: zinc ribbon domain-containing protein [Clostridia bacterium]